MLQIFWHMTHGFSLKNLTAKTCLPRTADRQLHFLFKGLSHTQSFLRFLYSLRQQQDLFKIIQSAAESICSF